MFEIGTPSFCALVRSMSTNSCGVLAENGENTVGASSVGDLRAAATSSSVPPASSSGPRPWRSWMRMVKPPPVPMPGIGGGGITMMNAPSIADSRLRRSAVIPWAFRPFLRRNSGSSNTGNSAAELLAWVRVAPDRPANTAICEIPGVSSAMLSILRTNVALRRGDEQPAGTADQHHIEQQHRKAMPDYEAGDVGIAVGEPFK